MALLQHPSSPQPGSIVGYDVPNPLNKKQLYKIVEQPAKNRVLGLLGTHSPVALGLEDAHVPTCWLLQYVLGLRCTKSTEHPGMRTSKGGVAKGRALHEPYIPGI